MLNINNILIAGGQYHGSKLWNKNATNLDNCFKLYHIEAGNALLVSEDGEHELVEGGVYFINGYQIERQYCPVSFRVNWLHFISDSIFVKQALLRFPVVTKLSFPCHNLVLPEFALFDSFFKQYSSRNNSIHKNVLANYFKIQSLILTVLGTLSENADLETFPLSVQGSRLLKAIEFIDANYKSTITLKQLASLCFMSDNYFHSLFKKEFTVTPNNYILQLRMNEALNLLSNTNLSVKEVARECGYPDAAYFSRTFSKYFGLSPNKYRSLHTYRTP